MCSTIEDCFFSTSAPFCSSKSDTVTGETQEKGVIWEVCAPTLCWSLDQRRWIPEQEQGAGRKEGPHFRELEKVTF